jgi:SAM-dependent methyltransferase
MSASEMFQSITKSLLRKESSVPQETEFVLTNRKCFSNEDRSLNINFYNNVAPAYAVERAWTRDTEVAIRDNLLRRVRNHLRVDDRVLVIGTGTGRDQHMIQEEGYSVFGIDLSHKMLAEAQIRINDHFTQGEAKYLPFPDNSFNFVYCEAVGEHLDECDLNIVLPEISRILVPDENRSADLLIGVRNYNGKVIRVRDMDMWKAFATYELGDINEIYHENKMTIVEQWQGFGGTPSLYQVPWLNSILKVNF